MAPPRRRLVIAACVEERRGAPMFSCRALPVNSERYSNFKRHMVNRPSQKNDGGESRPIPARRSRFAFPPDRICKDRRYGFCKAPLLKE